VQPRMKTKSDQLVQPDQRGPTPGQRGFGRSVRPTCSHAWAACLVGIAACGGGEQSRPNTLYSAQSPTSGSARYSSPTTAPSTANDAAANRIPATPPTAFTGKPRETTMKDEQVRTAEQVVSDMEAAFARKDVDGLVALFADDATIESYLVARIFHRNEGVCRGGAEIREVARALMQRGVPWRGHGPLMIRGDTVAIEWSASSPAEKFSVDILEIRDGKIQSLRAYGGWRPIIALRGGVRD
jgi:ketosteroid isomerase-like protein